MQEPKARCMESLLVSYIQRAPLLSLIDAIRQSLCLGGGNRSSDFTTLPCPQAYS
jgi:hypothetical protein